MMSQVMKYLILGIIFLSLVDSLQNNLRRRFLTNQNILHPVLKTEGTFLNIHAAEHSRGKFGRTFSRNRLRVILFSKTESDIDNQNSDSNNIYSQNNDQNVNKNNSNDISSSSGSSDSRLIPHSSSNQNIVSQSFIILGGSGDLSTTKIIPGLFDLYKKCVIEAELNEERRNNEKQITSTTTTTNTELQQTPHNDFNFEDFTITLVARSNWTNKHTREKLSVTLSKKEHSSDIERTFHERLVSSFLEKCTYTCAGTYSAEIMSSILGIEEDYYCNRRNIVYFALPPKQYLQPLQAMSDLRNVHNKKNDDNDSSNIENKENRNNANNVENSDQNRNRNENSDENNNEDVDMSGMNNMLDLILEKPIGYDTNTAKEILTLAMTCVGGDMDKIWCVDHYVAKDLVTSIIPLKTSKIPVLSVLFDGINGYFNSDYVSSVNVVFSDTGILDGRSGYFDDCGIIRDIITNHLIQLLVLICADVNDATLLVEPVENNGKNDNENNIPVPTTTPHNNPHDIEWNDLTESTRSTLISNLRSSVLQSIPPVNHHDFTVGQYASYVLEKGVKEDSRTDTFASCILQVPGAVWGDTIFRLTAGKGLDKKESVIKMHYKKERFKSVLTAVRAIEKEYPQNIPENSAENVSKNVPEERLLDENVLETKSLSLIFQVQPNPGIYIEEEKEHSSPVNEQKEHSSPEEGVVLKKTKKLILSLDDLPFWAESVTTDSKTVKLEETVKTEMVKSETVKVVEVVKMVKMEAYERVLRSIFFTENKNEYFPSVLEVLLQWNIFDEALIGVAAGVKGDRGEKGNRGEIEGGELMRNGVIGGEIVGGGGNGRVEEEVEGGKIAVEKKGVKLHSYRIGSPIESIVNRQRTVTMITSV